MNKLRRVPSTTPLPSASATFNAAPALGLALLFPLSMMFSAGTAERLLSAVRYLFAA
ncbi:hypothetical protein [Collimonas fungivorans]|uniref:hypothetical protein n=1 Tax=Collimonas fungivorans TaxID=158899 RepID=UPI001428B39B|nr:hypothetical protein [Collimonas fungivorans]